MAVDFRTLLKDSDSLGENDRWFEDIKVGNIFMSVQASGQHASTPREVLDPMEYEAFEVTLCNEKGVISYGKWGSWNDLGEKDWARHFSPDKTTPSLLVAKNMPTPDVQALYEDLIDYAEKHPL